MSKEQRDSLRGTNLYLDSRGIYVWRKVHQLTGQRIKRSCRTRDKRKALQKAHEFQEKYERELAGKADLDNWRLDLAPLADEWIASGTWTERRRAVYRSQITRALTLLNLRTPASLNDLAALIRRVNELKQSPKNPEGMPSVTLHECVQHPLKLFASWLAADRRYLDRNPLAEWRTIDTSDHEPDVSRALDPDEIARAFAAARCLDEVLGGEPQHPALVTMLVTSPRSDRLCQLNVEDLDAEKGYLDYGEAVGKKLPPAGALDPKTRDMLVAHRGERTSGPLFLSRESCRLDLKQQFRLDPKRLLRTWRRAMSLGVVDTIWPSDLRRDFADLYDVHLTLFSGKPYGGEGGNPKRMHRETRKHLAQRRRFVAEVADRLRDAWRGRMDGVTAISFRKTLRTWAMEKEVPEVLIDKQIGHRAPARDAALDMARQLIVSRTGRRYYFDPRLRILDPSRVAIAIRGLLHEAESDLARQAKAGATALAVAHAVAHGGSKPTRA